MTNARDAMLSIPVEVRGDVVHAQQAARTAAQDIGFNKYEAGELAIIASELATNILKYGIKGTMSFAPIVDPDRGSGICIVARDHGPQFRDFEKALEDGRDDAGPIPVEAMLGRDGLGTGLGAVKRFSDSIECLPLRGEQGKAIRVARFLRMGRR